MSMLLEITYHWEACFLASLLDVVFSVWNALPFFLGNRCKSQVTSPALFLQEAFLKWRTLCIVFSSVQSLSGVRLCDPMNHSTPGLPVHHHLPEFTQTHVHQVGDAIQPSHPLSSPSPPAPNLSQHQSLFQLVSSSREVSKVLEFQL